MVSRAPLFLVLSLTLPFRKWIQLRPNTGDAFGKQLSIPLFQTLILSCCRSYLYHADRSYALVLGRPNAIQDDYTSTLPPLNIDDEFNPQIRNSLPISTPTSMTFVILRHALAVIIGHMVHHFQQVSPTPSSYTEVIALDEELMSFVNKLPPHFSLRPDTSLDESSKYIRVHRFLLITEIWFVRINLHRPYLLRRLNSDRYQRSRRACFESAMRDFEIRQAFRGTMPRDARESLSNAYREFLTAMISGIYLVLEPSGEDAEEMHAILDGFIKDHEGVREMDETTRRELRTIEFLKRKASEAEGISRSAHRNRDGDVSAEHPPDSKHPLEAHLLLDLHQSGSTRRQPRPAFLPLMSREASASRGSPLPSPSAPYSNGGPYLPHSPTYQRLSQTAQAEGYTQSPTGSGSPSADDDSRAQSLLDSWCNPVSNGLVLEGSVATPGLSWGGSGGDDYPSLFGAALQDQNNEYDLMNSSEGSDFSFWESLVTQIQKGP